MNFSFVEITVFQVAQDFLNLLSFLLLLPDVPAQTNIAVLTFIFAYIDHLIIATLTDFEYKEIPHHLSKEVEIKELRNTTLL